MNQNQCVPNWDLDHVGLTIKRSPLYMSLASNSLSGTDDTSTSFGDEMTELAWENGKLTMLGLGQLGTPRKNNLLGESTHKPPTRAGGTLESLVNQGTHKLLSAPISHRAEYDYHNYDTVVVPTTASMGINAVVPSGVGCSTHVGSCSGAPMRVPQYSDWSVSASECGQMKSMTTYDITSDTSFGASIRVPQYSDWSVSASEGDQMKSMTGYGATSDTSFGASLDNTTITLGVDDLDHDPDSACHSVPKIEKDEEYDNKKKGTTKSISTMKRSRTAATHKKSEKKRRDNINQRMKTLQNLVPNSNKTNKASVLDEAIDYTKQLQAQVQMFNTMGLPSMMMPLALQQQLYMSMIASMGMGMGFGMGMNMDQMNMSINNNAMGYYPNTSGLPFSVLNPTGYMSLPTPSIGGDHETSRRDPLSTYQHFQQQQGHNQGASPYI